MRPCLTPGCPELVENGRCSKHSKSREKSFRDPRLRNKYKSARWSNARRRFLSDNPICFCGCGRLAEVVDHKIPIDVDDPNSPDFWDQSNWQSLTAICHNKKTARDLRERTY